jgi:hypothetical protein
MGQGASCLGKDLLVMQVRPPEGVSIFTLYLHFGFFRIACREKRQPVFLLFTCDIFFFFSSTGEGLPRHSQKLNAELRIRTGGIRPLPRRSREHFAASTLTA